jgi:hypothetical protein
MALSMEYLQYIGTEVVAVLRMLARADVDRLRNEIKDYHGFGYVAIPQEYLAPLHSMKGVDPNDVQIEIIHVARDLSHEVHHHSDSNALVIGLGMDQGFAPSGRS